MESQCRQCGKGFEVVKTWQRYCTSGCRNAWHGENRRRATLIGELRRQDEVQNAQRQARKVFGS